MTRGGRNANVWRSLLEGKMFLANGKASANALRQEYAYCVRGIPRKLVCLERCVGKENWKERRVYS